MAMVLGHYEWGSLLPTFSPLASVRKDSLRHILAGLFQNVAAWKTGQEFRQAIVASHELVHYQQDLLTGVGHWDYLAARQELLDLHTALHRLSWFSSTGPPYSEESVSDDNARQYLSTAHSVRDNVRANQIYLPNKLFPHHRSEYIRNTLSNIDDTDAPENVGGTYAIENLMEAEAYGTVWLTMTSLKGSEASGHVANAQSDLFSITAIPDACRSIIDEFAALARYFLGERADIIDQDEAASILKLHLRLMVVLIDLSFAHPSPDLLEARSASRAEYEPGLRCIRLIHALQRMPDSVFGDCLNALLIESDVWRAEDYLLQYCDYPYAHSRKVYQDWFRLFDGLAREDDDEVLQLRRMCSRRRLDASDECVYKSFPSTVLHSIPVLMMNPEGFVAHWHNNEYVLDEGRQNAFIMDVLRRNTDVRMVEYALSGPTFICPFAEARVCSAQTPACRSGLTSSDDFPRSTDCRVRQRYGEFGFFSRMANS